MASLSCMGAINSHGQLGYFNTPSAFNNQESGFSASIYRGHPDRKILLTGSPFNWLDATLFYSDITNLPYPGYEEIQTYKDKGYSFKVTLKEKGRFPAIAMGANDIAGTGFYSSEYIVVSDYVNRLEYSVGLGWGDYANGIRFKNPLININEKFRNRSVNFLDKGGNFDFNNYLSGNDASLFGALKYDFSKNLKLMLEYDPTLTPGRVKYKNPKTKFNFGIEYHRNLFSISAGLIRGNDFNIQFNYKRDFLSFGEKPSIKSKSKIKSYRALSNELKKNDIGLKSISKLEDRTIVDIRHTKYLNQYEVNEYVVEATKLINKKEILQINQSVLGMTMLSASFKASENKNIRNEVYAPVINKKLEQTLYRNNDKFPIINNKIKPVLKNFIAAREGFVFTGLMLENSLEVILAENLVILGNFKYSIKDDFDGLYIPPVDVYPAQVRSDTKDYYNNYKNGVTIGRLELDYFKAFDRKHFFRLSGGLFEDMFGGYGLDYLYHPEGSIISFGLEGYRVRKRSYEMRFSFKDFENDFLRASVNILEPVTNLNLNLSVGEYLAGDMGYTFEISRKFDNGVSYAVFFSRTDVSKELYGEGTFDKGIRLRIPLNIFNGNQLSSYEWHPLSKDPAALLIKAVELNDITERFRRY